MRLFFLGVQLGPGGSDWSKVGQDGPWWVRLGPSGSDWSLVGEGGLLPPVSCERPTLVVGVLILTPVTTGRAEQ